MPEAALVRLLGDGPLMPGGGVGLRLVRELARNLGGTIRHERETEVTRITVSLPIPSEARDAQE